MTRNPPAVPPGLDVQALERDLRASVRYAVAMRCAERALLPALCAAAPDELVIADGYSCREQIRQGTGREPLHIAQVMRMALA